MTGVITVEELVEQEKSLTQQEARLDHLLAKQKEEWEQTRDNLTAIRGALLQVRAQLNYLKQKAEAPVTPPAPAPKKDKPRRGKVAKKETPVSHITSANTPEPLADVA